jgi:hypothetical protein
MEHENLLPRREMTRYLFHPHRQAFSILPSPFSCNIDVALHFNAGLAERFLTPQSSLHICIPVLIASSCCNGILHIRDELTATISISASIQDVYESLARETERCSVGLTARRVEIRVYFFFDGRWERLALFTDVLELREERGVEGFVVFGF